MAKAMPRKPKSKPSTSANTAEKEKRVFVPPIVVNTVDQNFVKVLFEENYKFSPKLLATCIKIKPESLEEHTRISERLCGFKLAFHSYAPSRPKIFRVMAYGIPKMDLSTFKNEVALRQAPILDARFVDSSKNGIYLTAVVDFKRGETDLQQLNRKHNIVEKHIIRWGPATKRRNAIIICRRCAQIGHGITWCNESICCVYCAGEHFPKECTITRYDSEKKKIVSSAPKCANCAFSGRDDDHFATDIECPTALNEANRLKKYRSLYNDNRIKDKFSLQSMSWYDLRKDLANKTPATQSNACRNNTFASMLRSSNSQVNANTNNVEHSSRSRTRTTQQNNKFNLERRTFERPARSNSRSRARSRSKQSNRMPSASRPSNGLFGGDEDFEQLLSLEEVTYIALKLANGYGQCTSVNDQIKLIVNTINGMKNQE